jgi:4'-phosphopantetheinyl transferase
VRAAVSAPECGPLRDLLRVARPLHVRHVPAGPLIAAVSIAWLRTLEPHALERLRRRHLAPDEVEFAHALPFAKRRWEWLAGRLAIKLAVAHHLRFRPGPALATRAVRVTPVAEGPAKGKPEVNASVEVGLSHSADFAVAACAAGPVGIDVERRRDFPPYTRELLAFTPGELDHPAAGRLTAMPETLRWACKEAVLKRYGVGLRVDVREVVLTGWHADGTFTWRAGPCLRRSVPASSRPDRGWAEETGGYAVALVCR